jgi:hypothetical protein
MNYAARVSLDRTQMQVEDKLVNLSPGMAVTVEIKTGSRRIISYLPGAEIQAGDASRKIERATCSMHAADAPPRRR